MHISEKGINFIKDFEGLRTEAYLCAGGYKTIGYGHLLQKTDQIDEISELDADRLLAKDIAEAERSVLRNVIVDLTQGQFDALVSFTFNLGSAAFQRSTLRRKINRSEHEEVPKELMRWIYAGGIALAGLLRRRKMEAQIYSS